MGLQTGGLRNGGLRNLTEIAAIPDSEANQKLVHRWLLDTVGDGTAEDSTGTADGTVNGVQSVSGDWAGGAAGDGDGVDDDINLGTINWSEIATGDGFAIALSFQSITSDYSTFFGSNATGTTAIGPGLKSDGSVFFQLRDANDGYIRVTGDVANDGNPHRLVCQLTDPSGTEADMEIWTDQSEDTLSTDFANSVIDQFTDELARIFAEDNGGSPAFFIDSIIDDVCVFDDPLTQSEIESYQTPWT